MPYYDQDGRELSGRHDTSVRGDWIYTEDGGAIRSQAYRDRELYDSIAESQRLATTPSGPHQDGATLVLWVFKTILFTLPVKAIQLVLWSSRIGWRSGGWTRRACAGALGRRGMRPWLRGSIAFLAATVAFSAVTVGLVTYVVAGIVVVLSMDSVLFTWWLAPLLALIAGRLLWNAWQAIRSP